MGGHIVLLGDSIFDNAPYVPAGQAVIEQLRPALASGWQATLVAVDGAKVASAFDQVGQIPSSATHLVLSVGGNDALGIAREIFTRSSQDVRHALRITGEACGQFARAYTRLVDQLRETRLPLTLCTIYDAIPGLGPAELAGLCLFNDAITRTAFARALGLIDLRVTCSEASDYSRVSPIEPSTSGGAKIARAIVRITVEAATTSRVFA